MFISKLPSGDPEIYFAVQGEGKTVGKPCIFVRFSICNLKCKYCDSYFTWNFDDIAGKNNHYHDKVRRRANQTKISPEQLVEKITELSCTNIVFTGGEPMIYQAELIYVMKELRKINSKYYFEIETNGTIDFKPEMIELINQINCSPKLSSSGNPVQISQNLSIIKHIAESKKAIFKFVVTYKEISNDISEIVEIQTKTGIPNEMIWLMPCGIERRRIIKGSKIIIENLCCAGYNLGTRLHILLYQNRRLT